MKNSPYRLAVGATRFDIPTLYPIYSETAALAAEEMLTGIGLFCVVFYEGYDY